MALVLDPDLLIADEPTTALDVTVQAQILELIGEMKERLGIGVVLISHNMSVIADVAQNVMIMYAGRPVEIGTRDEIFRAPRHPYAWGCSSRSAPGRPGGAARAHRGSRPRSSTCRPAARSTRAAPTASSLRPRGAAVGGRRRLRRDACLLSLDDKRRLWIERQQRFQDAAA